MNVLYSPKTPENTVGDDLNVCLGHVIGIRSWPINLNLCPAS